MYQTLLGREGFRKGMDLYFERHDGQAVTCDDFRARDGRRQRPRPRPVRALVQPGRHAAGDASRARYDADAQTYDAHAVAVLPADAGPADKLPFHIPVAVGLLAATARDLPLELDRRRTAGTRPRACWN